MVGINHGTNDMDFTKYGKNFAQMLPRELHFKENGTRDDKPSFAILMNHPMIPGVVVGQLSLKTWNEALGDVGYEIVKKKVETPVDPEWALQQRLNRREVRFPANEDMHCPECKMPMPHTLIKARFNDNEELWTCILCNHQLENK